MDWIEVAIAALVAALILLVEHYAPGGTKNQVINYILGVLALIIPLSGLMILWGLWMVVVAIWIVVASGGIVVMAAYWIDSYLALMQRVKAAEDEAQVLRPEIHRGEIDG